MSWTQADLDALKAARAKGVKKVRIGEEEVEYRSDAEMASVQRAIEADLGVSTSGSRVVRPVTSLGWR